MKKYILYSLLAIILLGLIGGYWYWYEYRTSEIRKNCANQASERAFNKTELWTKNYKIKTENWYVYYNDEYSICLQEKGI